MGTKNIISGLLPYLPQFIFGMIRLILVIGLIVFGIIKGIQFLRKNKFFGKTKTIILSIILILLVSISWVFNMGWLRIIMTILFIPIIHSVVFFFMNLCSARYFNESKRVKLLNVYFILTFLIAYFLMPDGGDYGEMYFFFGLVHSDILSAIACFVSTMAFVGHIVLFVMQIIEIKKIMKNTKESQ